MKRLFRAIHPVEKTEYDILKIHTLFVLAFVSLANSHSLILIYLLAKIALSFKKINSIIYLYEQFIFRHRIQK